jgi:hypothetical protein
MSIVLMVIAWALTISTVLSIATQFQQAWRYGVRLHQIPCSRCRYFTNTCYLKCTVHPQRACSEQAILCQDFVPGP